MELTRDVAESLLRGVTLDLIRRGDDGSLRMSADRWRLEEALEQALHFRTEFVEGFEVVGLTVDLAEVVVMTWDQLPKQERRSQVRFRFKSGDVWTFSGYFETTPVLST